MSEKERPKNFVDNIFLKFFIHLIYHRVLVLIHANLMATLRLYAVRPISLKYTNIALKLQKKDNFNP